MRKTIPISCRVKQLRRGKKLTQEALAKQLGISRQALFLVETGQSIPSLSLALQMANLFQKQVEEIFCDNFLGKGVSNNMEQWPMSPWWPSGPEAPTGRRPFGLSRIHDELDRLFEEGDHSSDIAKGTAFVPVDVIDKGKEVIVECQLPGIKAEDVNIQVNDTALEISGERKHESEIKEENYYHKESSYGLFSRTVELPSQVLPDKAQAEFEDGILTVTLPKTQPVKTKKPVKIKVKGK